MKYSMASILACSVVWLLSCNHDKPTGPSSLPPAPSILRITGVVDSTVYLCWTQSNAKDYSCYKVFCSSESSSVFSNQVDSVIVRTDTTFIMREQHPGTRYYFGIETWNSSSKFCRSNIVDTAIPAIHQMQSSILRITSTTDSAVSLAWSASAAGDYSLYELCCWTDSTALFEHPVDSFSARNDTICTLAGLVPEKHYYFGLMTYGNSSRPAASNIVDTTITARNPLLPSTVFITGLSDSTVTCVWNPSKATDFASYQLFCSSDSSGLFARPTDSVMTTSDTVRQIRNLKPQTHYYISVATISTAQQIVRSNIATTTTKPTNLFQFKPMPDTMKPVFSVVGLTGGLVVTRNASLSGTVALYYSFVQNEAGRRILDSNITSKTIGGFTSYFPLPFAPEKPDSVFRQLARLKSAPPESSPNTAWDSVISLTGISILAGQRFNRALIVSKGSLTIPAVASAVGCIILSDSTITINGSTTNCLIMADSGITLSSGVHSSQFLSHGLITIRASANLSASNAIISHRPLSPGNKYGGGIAIDSQSTIRGLVISYGDPYGISTFGTDIAIVTGGQSRIEGTLITDRTLTMKNGTIIGHVWCNRLENVDNLMYGYNVGFVNYLWGMTVHPPVPDYQVPVLGAPYINAVDLFP